MPGPGLGAGQLSIRELEELARRNPEQAKRYVAQQRAQQRQNRLSQPGTVENLAGKMITGLDPSLMRHQVGATRRMGKQTQVYDYRKAGNRYEGGWFNQPGGVQPRTSGGLVRPEDDQGWMTRGGTYQIPRPWTPQGQMPTDEGGPWIGPGDLGNRRPPPQQQSTGEGGPWVGSGSQGRPWRPGSLSGMQHTGGIGEPTRRGPSDLINYSLLRGGASTSASPHHGTSFGLLGGPGASVPSLDHARTQLPTYRDQSGFNIHSFDPRNHYTGQ